MLWEIVTQKYPFDELYDNDKYSKVVGTDENGESVRELRLMKIKAEIVENELRPASKFDDVPSEFSVLIVSCWNKFPISRPTMNTMVPQLCTLLKKRFNITRTPNVLPQWTASLAELSFDSIRTLAPPKQKGAFNIRKTKSVCFTDYVFALCTAEFRLWVGLSEGKVHVLSLPDLRVISSLQCFSKQSRVYGLLFIPADESVWALSDKGELAVVKSDTLEVVHRVQYTGMFKDILLATAGTAECTVWGTNPDNNSVFVWRSKGSRELLKTISNIPGACLLAQGGVVVFIAGIGQVVITEAVTFQTLTVVDLTPKRSRCPEAMCFYADFLWICPAGASSVIEVYTPDGQHFTSLKGHSGCVKSLCPVLTVNGVTRTILSGGFDGSVLAWKVNPKLPPQEQIKCNAEISINRKSSVECMTLGPLLVSKTNISSPGKTVNHTIQFYCGLLCGEVAQIVLDPGEESF